MNTLRKFLPVLVAFGILIFAGIAYGTASQIGSGGIQSSNYMTTFPIETQWISTADVEFAVTLPAEMGAPNGILTYQIDDLDTDGKGKTAIANGEGFYIVPSDYEAADLSDGQITVYRGDMDGGDTTALQQSIVGEIWLYWSSYGDLTW